LKRFLEVLTSLSIVFPPLVAAAPARKPAPNVILIMIDTVRADHLGCYGSAYIETPTLDALAHDGIVFERAISQVPLTWPSHAVILTGTYPFQNGVQDFTGQPLAPQFRSVAQAFKQNGYTTGAVVSAFVLDRSWGLARGFDFYDDAFSAQAFQQKDIGLVDRKAGESVTHALNWLNQDRLQKTPRRPFFFWLHLYDPHSPYDPPEPYRTQYRSHLYDGEIAYTDHELGRLITWLKRNQLYHRTLIVFLSDHGESLGDHGEKEHGFFVYNSTVHVPLIVKPPGGNGFRPMRVPRPVETVAVAPTLLHSAGIKDEIEKQFQSHGLFGPNSENEDTAYSETFYSFSSFGWSPLHALETSRYHYIEAPQPELYDVIADPQEKNNLTSQQAATVAVLKDKLQGLLRHNPFTPSEGATSGLSPDALEKLRALGYVAYRSPVSTGALAAGLPDPKDKLPEFNSILSATDAFQAGEREAGEALLEKVQEQDPKTYVIPFLLGESNLRYENWEKAADALKRCLELNPNFDNAMTGLALALAKLGRSEEAKGWLDKALAGNVQNYRAWYQKGLLEEVNNPTAAEAAYKKAIAIQPNFFPGQRALGMLLFQQRKYAPAAVDLERAIWLGVDDARIHNYLGICYAQTNRLAKAVREYQRAIEIDPELAEAHLNLGFAYEKLGNNQVAKAEYDRACQLSEQMCRLIPSRRK
jgi:choline-sulfatase